MNHKQQAEASNPVSIRRASKEDSVNIFALKWQAFGDAFLRYTIYQAPASVEYLERLITFPDPTKHHIYVLADDKNLVGYYQAVSIDDTLFLNYIAVDSIYRGRHYGQQLLEHYEQFTLGNRFEQLALDVFANNVHACDWYFANGYQQQSASYLVQLPMTRSSSKNYHLITQAGRLEQALFEEGINGFSKVEFRDEDASVVVGLINGNSCKLLTYDGISIEDSILFTCKQFGADRESLIVSGLPNIPPEWTPIHSDKVLRLTKVLR